MLTRSRKAKNLVAAALALLVLAAGCRAATETPTPSPTPSPLPKPPPGLTFASYRNTERGFSIDYPRGWSRNERTLGKTFDVEFREPERSVSFFVYTESRPNETSLAEAIQEAKDMLRVQTMVKVTSQGEVTVGDGLPGYELVYAASNGARDEQARHIMMARGKQSVDIEVRGEPAVLDAWKQPLDSMLRSFRLLPDYSPAPPDDNPGGTYTDGRYGFSVSYRMGWFEVPVSRPGQVVSYAYSEEGQPGVTISLLPVQEGTSLVAYAQQLERDLGNDWGDFKLISRGEITLRDGTPAYQIVFSGTTEGRTFQCKYVIVIRGSEVFLVMGFTQPERYEEDEKRMDPVIYSFRPG